MSSSEIEKLLQSTIPERMFSSCSWLHIPTLPTSSRNHGVKGVCLFAHRITLVDSE